MAIKSYEKINTTDINALKEKINTIYNNRPISITDYDRNNIQITKNFKQELFSNVNTNVIVGNEFKNMLNGLLIINSIPNLLYANQYDIILNDGLTDNLMTILNDTNKYWNASVSNNAHPVKNQTGCRGACVGFCSGGCSNTSYSNG